MAKREWCSIVRYSECKSSVQYFIERSVQKLAYKTLCGCRQSCGKLDKPLHTTSHEPALVGVEDWVYRAEN